MMLPTFTTPEICKLISLPTSVLNEWVGKGLVHPVKLGGKGRSRSHRYSPQQAFGLAMCAGTQAKLKGADPASYVPRIMSVFLQLTDEDIAWLFKKNRDPWDQEVLAERLATMPYLDEAETEGQRRTRAVHNALAEKLELCERRQHRAQAVPATK